MGSLRMVSLYWVLVPVTLGLVYQQVTNWAQGGVCESTARMEGKVVVITGSSSGIGRETALDLSRRGAEVHMLCRNMEKAKMVKESIELETGNEVFLHHIDLASLDSVKKCVNNLKKDLKKIDVLINNAGVMATPEWRTEEGFELQFGTNHLGHFLLTTEILPLLRKSEKSRVVVVSSSAHAMGTMDFNDLNWISRTYSSMAAYGQSKLANILFAKELVSRERELGSGVRVYSLHPGVVKTELSRHFKNTFGNVLFYLAKVFAPLYKTPESGAQTSICCAVDPALENETGKYYKDCMEADTSPSAESVEDAKKLWAVSMELVEKWRS